MEEAIQIVVIKGVSFITNRTVASTWPVGVVIRDLKPPTDDDVYKLVVLKLKLAR